MRNFEFHCDTKIIFGKDTEALVVDEIKQYGNKVLLVYYDVIKQIGLYHKVVGYLKEAGIEFVELSGVVPNPRLSLVKEGIELCRRENVDLILAVGGGSVIDTAKAIGMGVPYEGDVWDFFLRKAEVKETLPVGVILTVAAAGSETSNCSVITNEETNLKRAFISPLIRPKFSILNPELLYTVPAYHTAAGGVDAMSHIMEKYFTSDVDVDLTDRLSEATLRTIIKYLPKVLEKPDDYNARAQILWASTMAQNGILGVGRGSDGCCHAIAGEVTGLYDTIHGATLAIVTPAWMKYVFDANIPRFAQFAVRVWDVEPDFNDLRATALEGIRRTEEFFKSVGMPVRLSEVGIPEEALEVIAERSGARTPIGAIKTLEVPDVLEILKLAYK